MKPICVFSVRTVAAVAGPRVLRASAFLLHQRRIIQQRSVGASVAAEEENKAQIALRAAPGRGREKSSSNGAMGGATTGAREEGFANHAKRVKRSRSLLPR